MKIETLLAAPLLALALAAPLAAEAIKLANGDVVNGRATAYDDAGKILHFRTDDGRDVEYPLAQLDARSVYLVHSSVVPKDSGKGQLQLANFARDAGLFAHAARRYGYAQEADPSLAAEVEREREVLRKEAATFCLAQAREAEAKGDASETEKWLKLLLEKLPDEPQAAEAAEMLDARYTQARAAKQAAVEADLTEDLQREVARGKQSYESMVDNTKKGLTARNGSQSERLWKSAVKDGERVLSEIERIEKKYPDDPRVREGADRYRKLTQDQLIETYLHLANHALVSTSYNEATRYCNQALALDSQSQAALSMRARIEAAASERGDVYLLGGGRRR